MSTDNSSEIVKEKEKSLGKEVGEKLRKERDKRKLTLREVGEATGIDYSYLGRIERGSLPSSTKLRKLADFYEIPMASLFGEEMEVPQELKDIGVEWISFSKEMADKGID
ncbi:helix-turn-helix transcriptional regulator, partial [Escherichia coli]|nr:helix-turn-helix transcriptional regulator [Escherichia coli]